MPNWCENTVIIRGQSEEVRKYKDSLLQDSTGQYYPWISSIPLPEIKSDDIDAYIEKEYNKTLFNFHYRATELDVIVNNDEELVLHFWTAYIKATNLCTEDLFPTLSILHKYFEPIRNFHGFIHYVDGEVIAQGHEDGDDLNSPWKMYNYAPFPADINPLEEKLKNYAIIPADELHEIYEFLEEEGTD
jgi:hypothetical protein